MFACVVLHSSIVGWVLECRCCLFEDWVGASVPLGLLALLLKLGKLSPVVNLDKDLPHDDEGDAGSHDGPDDAQDNAEDVHDLRTNQNTVLRRVDKSEDSIYLRTLLVLLHPDLQLSSLVVVTVDIGEATLVFIQVSTQSLVLMNIILCLLYNLQTISQLKGTLGTLLHSPLILLTHEGSREEVFALDTGLQLVTFTWKIENT